MMSFIYLMDHIKYSRIFEYIIKKHKTISDNPPKQIYINKTNNCILFKLKTGYKLELLSEKTMRLLRSTEKDIDKDKNGENVPKVKMVEVELMNCYVVNNDYQQASKVLFTFVRNKKFRQLISTHSLLILKTTNTEFSFIEVWFTDENNRLKQETM